MKLLLLVIFVYTVIPICLLWDDNIYLTRFFLVTSNLFSIPAFFESIKRELWFEASYLSIMTVVSITYHVTYGWTGSLGIWFRNIDWLFALTTGPIFLNYFFMHKHSHGKMVSNFWILAVITVFTHEFMEHTYLFVIPLAVYIFALFFTRRRHMTNLTPRLALAVLFWGVVGLGLFFIADKRLYWLLHSFWHVCIFTGIYYLLRLGCLDDEELIQVQKNATTTTHNNVNTDNKIFF